MTDFIKKYLHDTDMDGEKNHFFPPATEKQIYTAEQQFRIEFPNDYKDFLRFTNGFDGMVGESVAVFKPIQTLFQTTRTTTTKNFPGAIFLGSNTGLEMYILSTRQKPYQFGLLPNIFDKNDFRSLGETFEKFLNHLYFDTVFDT